MRCKGHFITVFIIALFFTVSVSSQNRIEGGLFLGTSYYNGDLNPGKQFYNSKPAVGALVRVVFNERIAFKGTLTSIGIGGQYPQSGIQYPSVSGRSSSFYSFQRSMADISTQLEINFFEYDHPFRREQTRFTPFISGGLAYTVYRRYESNGSGGSENPHFILSLPFGAGVKWKAADWLHVGLEWTFRKTFVDDLDFIGSGDINPTDPYGFQQPSDWHNNDWYSFAGVFITMDIFHKNVPCNAGY